MKSEWNEIKARTNQAKHGVSFLEATGVFADGYSSVVHDSDHSVDEDRYLLFGVSSREATLLSLSLKGWTRSGSFQQGA